MRTTLDPKLQAWRARRCVDGLVRFDEARGWRGAPAEARPRRPDWGLRAGRRAGARRRPAVAPGGGAGGRRRQARIGLQPDGRLGQLVARARARRASPPTALEVGPARSAERALGGRATWSMSSRSKAGRATFRLRQMPEISGALVAMDPYTGRVLAMVGGFSFAQSEFNRATQACASRAPPSSRSSTRRRSTTATRRHPWSWTRRSKSITAAGHEACGSPENYDGKFYRPATLRSASSSRAT